MAALNQEKFSLATDDTIEELQNSKKNSRSTSFWLSMWKTWCEEMIIALDIISRNTNSVH